VSEPARTRDDRYDGTYGRLRELGDMLRSRQGGDEAVRSRIAGERAAEVRRLVQAGCPPGLIAEAMNYRPLQRRRSRRARSR
jgi:hypothetical protein